MITKNLHKQLMKIAGKSNVLGSELDQFLYEYDASMDSHRPDVIVMVNSTEQVQGVVSLAHRAQIPLVPRGSGTNLSGGSVPVNGGIVMDLTNMNRILEIDIANERAVVECGVFNLQLQNALAPYGYQYAPDPASQKVSTIGGNAAENAGGPHCLKYGVTTNHVLGLKVVLANGELRTFGGKALDGPGYDLVGVMVGSEGTLGIITEVTVRIIPLPQEIKTLLVVFNSIEAAAATVSEIIARGIIPASLEMMDRLTVRAVEESLAVGYPTDAEAVLLIEIDGPSAGLVEQVHEIEEICTSHDSRDIKIAGNASDRDLLWSGRRGALASMTRLRPSIVVADGTVPRTKLPQVLKDVDRIAKKYRLQHGNLLHAGNGNLHPNLVFDIRNEDELRRVTQANSEILRVCVDAGGTISGEHGIGIDKINAMQYLFSREDMSAMFSLKRVFDAQYLMNPGKIFPEEIYSNAWTEDERTEKI